jgi:hypothetical protein
MNRSFSFSLPSSPDSYDEMEVDQNEQQQLPSTTEASIHHMGLEENDDCIDLDNEQARNIAPRMPLGDITARMENSQHPSAPPATVPLHAGAILIISKTVKAQDKADAKIGEINRDCENLLQETMKKAASTLRDGAEMNLVSQQADIRSFKRTY